MPGDLLIEQSATAPPPMSLSTHLSSHIPWLSPACTYNPMLLLPLHEHPHPRFGPSHLFHPSLTSNGSGSSGFSSLGSSNGQAYPPPPISAPSPDRSDSAHGTSSTVSPTNSIDMMANLTIQVCQKGQKKNLKNNFHPLLLLKLSTTNYIIIILICFEREKNLPYL